MANRHSTLIPAAGYARRSTDLQDRSIPDQIAYIEKWAKENGYKIVRWFIDDAISGTSIRKRDDFTQMIETAENGRDFDTILCYDISRFSRGGTNETGYYLHRLKLAGINVLFPAEGIPEGDEGELIQGVKSWQAKQFSVKLSRDVIRGTISYVGGRGGAPGGVPPYGYDKQHVTADGKILRTLRWLADGTKQEYGPDGKFLRILAANQTAKKTRSDLIRYVPSDPERVAVVRRVFERYVAGRGFVGISHELNNDGIPALIGETWSPHRIQRMIANPVYRGAAVWNRRTCGSINGVGGDGKLRPKPGYLAKDNPKSDWIIAENAHEALISPELFAEAQRVREKRRDQGGLARSTNRSLLSGLIVCSSCGYNMYQKYHNHVTEAGIKIRYYVDSGYNRRGKTVCKAIHVPADALDLWVVEKVRKIILGKAKTVTEAVDAFVAKVLKKRPVVDDAAAIEKELAGLAKRIKATVALLADPDLDDLEELRATLVDLKARRTALEAQRRNVSQKAGSGYDEGELRAWAATRFERLAKDFDPRNVTLEFRQVVHSFVDRVEIATKSGRRGCLYLAADAFEILEKERITRVARGDLREEFRAINPFRESSVVQFGVELQNPHDMFLWRQLRQCGIVNRGLLRLLRLKSGWHLRGKQCVFVVDRRVEVELAHHHVNRLGG